MFARTPSPLSFLASLLVAAGIGACAEDKASGGGDATIGADAADTRDAVSDTVIPPDTIPTETVDTAPEAQEEVLEPGGFGAPCNTNGDCDSGYCVDGPKGYVCTRTCDTTCPTGYDCRAVSGGTDVVFLCLPRLRENCQPCATNFQCQGGLCLEYDGQFGCAFPCDEEEGCPDGFTCADTDAGEGAFCQPDTGSCSCYAGADSGLRSCTNANEIGTCTGVQECDPATGWSACDAATATVETCNGVDDDCDGVWDDSLEGVGASCVNAVEGVGECTGVQVCLGEAGWLCIAATPQVEVCNNQDDDCDGAADEDFRDEAGQYVQEDNCGGCGVACAGKIPNATAFCSGAGLSPRCEVHECDPGYYQVGPLTCLPIVDNSCVPCLSDSHCTTPGDRCLDLDGARYCGRDCGPDNSRRTPPGECPDGFSCEELTLADDVEVEQCVPLSRSCTCLAQDSGKQRPCTREAEGFTCFGTQTCDAATGWSACDAQVPAAETCNLVDDDCNGAVDDVPGRFEACPITNSNGTCMGQFDCRTGAALSCVGQTPAAETCNGRDDDCDGQTDEVPAPACTNQKGVCAGSARICAGQLGFLECNAASYGSNYELSETKCDGLDNDCDGITDEVDLDGDGHKPIACGGDDCNDSNRLVYPGVAEICGDALDNDCNGVPDDLDLDDDSWISAACGGPDCNDFSSLAKPGGIEVCGDRLDNDCDGIADNVDNDRDNFLSNLCQGPDCNDARFDVHPGAEEMCDGVDNNCNGLTDERDVDSDGFRAKACGGDDCDDSRPTVNPDGVEVCNNNIDEDCSGQLDDRDIDGDGETAEGCGVGHDCDDFDPQTRPGRNEVWDGKDNDCDGIIDEGVIPVGSIIVSEIMVESVVGGADDPGEYFELTNVSPFPINMRGWTIWDCGSDSSTCSAPAGSTNDIMPIATDIIVQPGGTAVFCRLIDKTANGGIDCDYGFIDMALANTGDELIVSAGPVFAGQAVTAVEMDRVVWTSGAAQDGLSYSLLPHRYSATDNDTGSNWCSATTPQIGSSGNFGTPGKLNPGDCTASPPPAVALVLPNNGIAAGLETVAVIGSGFVNGSTSVSIGGAGCGSVQFIDANLVICTTGAGTPGSASVTVTVNATPSTALANGYTYTVEGDGNVTTATLSGTSYTAPAGDVGALIKATVQVSSGTPRVELGYGPNNSNPASTPNWSWFPAAVFPTPANTWSRALVIDNAGRYAVAYRASTDGVTWRYTSRITATITP